MSNTKKFNGAIRVGQFSADPSDTEVGTIYYDNINNKLKFKNNSQYKAVLGSLSDDLTPSLGGDLDILNKVIKSSSNEIVLAPQASVRRAKNVDPTQFVEEEYLHSISLLASQTGTVVPSLSFDSSVFEAVHITYKMKDSLSAIRTGTIMIVSDGTLVSISDGPSVETASVNITFNTQITLGIVDITYTSGTETAVIRVDVKRIKA